MRFAKVCFLLLLSGFTVTHTSAQIDTNNRSSITSASGNTSSTNVTMSVSGHCFDAHNEPIAYATITLMRKDSSIAGGDLTKDDGSFRVTTKEEGTYMLRISAIGLKDRIVPNIKLSETQPNKDLGTIKATQSSTTLKEVDIVAERRMMEMKVDKKVFNVEKNTTTAGGSASDVLANVPSVSVDVDGTVSLRGRSGVTILIDGRPSTLLGTDAATALQSLPASSIESVEVITNPSAKYDAQGLTGIINIITKKDSKLGINGNVTLGAGTRDKYNGSVGLNVRKGSWNVFLNSSARLNRNYTNSTMDRYDKTPDFASQTLQSYHNQDNTIRRFNGFFNSVGATYDINKKNSITFTQNINIMNFGLDDNASYWVYGDLNKTDLESRQDRTSKSDGGPHSYTSSLDYKAKFKKPGHELNVDASYSSSNMTRTQKYVTNTYVGDNIVGPVYEDAPGSGGNTNFTAWADYTNPLFTKNGKLGLGFKTQFYDFNSRNNPIIDSPAGSAIIQQVDSNLLAIYDYTQQVHAAYVNWSDQYDKFTYQVGLRLEDAIYDGVDKGIPGQASYSNNFLNLFPSAFVSYQLPRQQSIYLNYSRRTNRPWFMDLLPYKDVANPSIVRVGNPALEPEFINSLEFSYSKNTDRGDNLILSAYYQYTENLIERVTRPIEASDTQFVDFAGRQLARPENLASGITYGFEATGHVQFIPIWDATFNVNMFQNEIHVGNDVPASVMPYIVNNSGFSWFGKVNTNLKLPAGFSFQVNANYESPKVVAQGNLKQVYWIDVALRKNLWSNKATIVANLSDIFNTRKYTTDYNLTAYNQTMYRDRETRIGNLTFTYRFGKSDMGNGSKRDGGDMGSSRKGKSGKKTDAPQQKDRENNLKSDDSGNDQGGGGAPQGGGSGK